MRAAVFFRHVHQLPVAETASARRWTDAQDEQFGASVHVAASAQAGLR